MTIETPTWLTTQGTLNIEDSYGYVLKKQHEMLTNGKTSIEWRGVFDGYITGFLYLVCVGVLTPDQAVKLMGRVNLEQALNVWLEDAEFEHDAWKMNLIGDFLATYF